MSRASRINKLARRLAAIVQVIAVIFLSVMQSSPSYAIQIQLSRGLQFQTLDEQSGEESETLGAGSVVDIPAQFRVNDASGKFSAELTLNNWLGNAGRIGMAAPDHQGGLIAHGQGFVDYFYPVTIVSAAPGSRLKTFHGRSYFLALRQLTRTQGQLVTNQNATVTRTPPGGSLFDDTEGSANCPNGLCQHNRTTTPNFDRLVSDLSPVLRKLKARETSNERRTADDFQHLADGFYRSCGFSLQSFIPVVKAYAQEAGVPSDIALSIMVQESSGRCYSHGFNGGDNSYDSGLFGVNSRTAPEAPRCTREEVAELRQTPARALANGPQCLENPVINLQLGLQILRNKADSLTQDRDSGTHGFDRARLVDSQGQYTRTAWRLAISAYNGGERWVFRAKKDLENFNRVNGTNLDATNWQDLRIFYLRRFLAENKEQHYFGSVTDGRGDSAIANLSYTENVAPVVPSTDGLSTIAELWK